jgi:hypothetical protein
MNETATMEMERPLQTAEQDELSIPLDLSAWVPVATLREWIMSSVATLDWTNAELLEMLRLHPDFEPKALLNTMTFALATGIFGADEIARSCSSNPDFRGIRPRLPPVVSDLKQFRKENRGLLKWALAGVITRALKTQFIEGESIDVLPVGLRRYIFENATERLDIARHLDRRDDLL